MTIATEKISGQPQIILTHDRIDDRQVADGVIRNFPRSNDVFDSTAARYNAARELIPRNGAAQTAEHYRDTSQSESMRGSRWSDDAQPPHQPRRQ